MRVAIVTKNAVHGGVETQIALQQVGLNASVFVAGGPRSPLCPFDYEHVTTEEALLAALRPFDAVLYHWPPDWAVRAIARSGLPSVEYVHRVDTADCDKRVPTRIVAHSPYLAAYIIETFYRPCSVIPLMLDVDTFPDGGTGDCIGGMTSYIPFKGIDLFLRAWAPLEAHFPAYTARFYGAGGDLPALRELTAELGLRRVELLDAVARPIEHIGEYALCVAPSRLEGMPVAILEALASNVPVICADLEGMRDFNRTAFDRGYDEPLQLFKSEDVGALTAKLAAWLAQPTKPTTRTYMKKYYGVERGIALLREALDSAVANKRAKMSSLPRLGPADFQELSAIASQLGQLQQALALRLLDPIQRFKLRLLPGARPILDQLHELEQRLRNTHQLG